MSIKFLKYREPLLVFLIVLVFLSFTLSFAINSIATFLLLAVFFFDSPEEIRKKVQRIVSDRLVMLYVVFFAVQLVGLLYSEDFKQGLRRVSVLIPILFVPAVLCAERLEVKQVQKVLDIVKIGVPITFICLLVDHLIFMDKALNTFVHFTINEKIGISQFYLAFILILPLIECLRCLIQKQKVISNLVFLAINLGVIFLLGNKTVLFFLILLALLISIKTTKRNWKQGCIIIGISVSAIVVASQITIIQNRVNVFLKTTDFDFATVVTKNNFTITKNTVEHRFLIDYIALNAIKNGLPLGYGTGDYLNVLYDGYNELNFKAGIHYKYNAHNQYFSEFLKTGILGGVTFIVLIAILLKQVDFENYFTLIILFFALGCCFESYLYRQHGVVIFSFVLPFLIYNTPQLKIHTK